MTSEIVQKEDKVLRKMAKEVPISDIESRKIQTIIRRMQKALDKEDDGVAIAAPQIGESLRIFVLSKKIFEIMDEEKASKKSKRENLEEFEKQKPEYKDMVFINPEILKTSKEKKMMEEGCLSVRWLYGKVERSQKTLIKAYNENGKLFTMGGTGLLSQAFQHETDHLNGVMFIDKAKNLKDIPPLEQK
ncbi:MAG: hypothetical protein A2431_03330 [Candidatus Zambryskibacteria bacterium RIFOXYC1_FULL_39_10]|uniref:Peptide deformylase n=1 Tax=Candidatus Zambryskibacteria bacterium RIFOXYC1_FULL_39_10 TaxID=1802779 RepID=A0A1G2UYT5_9BACT|nr:MAG: hypothetical protein A2431_03330 [Candidatus Zambryskibacteria bacterium RIFOXYC1_FULL_39_10]OHB15442.1 MAG: hypothetical protein A2605_03540 [Candidatus Zambryskibacteria bacterium RIFOXYD1_FULL_39_35]